MPAVSVIVPTYNRASVLPRAIASVINQTCDDWELIVVDDGSSDGSAALPILRSSPKIALVRLTANHGVSHARNRGIAVSTGAWLAFLDSDDEWHPAKLERQMAWLAAHPGCRIMQCQEIWIRRGVRVNPPKTHRKVAGNIFRPSLQRCMITPSAAVMERSLLEEAGGFDETMPACEDYDLWLRIACRHEVGLLDEFLLNRYGGHADQLSATVAHLDQYRVESMMRLLAAGVLTREQAGWTRAEIATRAGYLAQGSRKSGNQADYERFSRIADQYRQYANPRL